MATGSNNNFYGDWQRLQPKGNVVDEVFTEYQVRHIIGSGKEYSKPKELFRANSDHVKDTSQKQIQLSMTKKSGKSSYSTATETEDRSYTNPDVTEVKVIRAARSSSAPPAHLVIGPGKLNDTTVLKFDFVNHVLEGLSLLCIRKQRRSLRMYRAGFTFLLWVVAVVMLTFVGYLLHLY